MFALGESGRLSEPFHKIPHSRFQGDRRPADGCSIQIIELAPQREITNRYTDRPIKIADASIGKYRVTGVFETSDPAHFATAMSEVFPIEVRRDPAGSPVLDPAH